MLTYKRHAEIAALMLRNSPAWQKLDQRGGAVDDDLLDMILEQAAGHAEGSIAPINTAGDLEGARLVDGRVKCPSAYHDAWREFAESGWIAPDLAEESGGQGLPLAVQSAVQSLFDRACPAFVMVGGSTRSACFVIEKFASDALRAEWLPKLSAGEWTATICISEPDAGSDVGRIRTLAVADGEKWRISGQKCWISFGDHDLTERIGHIILARTPGAALGTRGLSLFLLPSTREDGAPNGITIERIEEKLGLHGSPTCVMSFDRSEAYLLGREERGLSQMFVMIERMRLLTAGQGVGAASAAMEIAQRYAQERRQGGRPDQPPVPIIEHGDVKRQLAVIESRTEIMRAFAVELAALIDLAKAEGEDGAATHALAAWMMPLAKNFGAETGFDVASGAIQILGGAGYTREWPAEQILRDTRILSIFEGTTGMQALDLMYRRLWGEEGRGLAAFLEAVEDEAQALAGDHGDEGARVRALAGRLRDLAARLTSQREKPGAVDVAADSFMRAAWAVAQGWMALRLLKIGANAPSEGDWFKELGSFALDEAEAQFAAQSMRVEQLLRWVPAKREMAG